MKSSYLIIESVFCYLSNSEAISLIGTYELSADMILYIRL